MSIKNMTERTAVRITFPELGKLHKGAPRSSSSGEIPPDLDYFRFTSENPAIVDAFHAAFGPKPRSLHVFLPFKTAEENFSTNREKWGAGGLIIRCDGEYMILHLTDAGTYSQERLPCPYCSGQKPRTKKDKGCQPIGRLNLIIPELLEIGYAGYVTLETGAINDLKSIMASLLYTEETQKIYNRPGGLRGIEFRLWRQEEAISTPAENTPHGRARRRKWMVKLSPAIKWVAVQYQLEQKAASALPAWVSAPEPEDEDAEDGEFSEIEETENTASPPEADPADTTTEEANFIRSTILAFKNGHMAKDGQPATEKQVGLLYGQLKRELGDDAKAVIKYVFDKDLDQISFADAMAMLSYMLNKRENKDEPYRIKDAIKPDLHTLARAAKATAGQQELPF